MLYRSTLLYSALLYVVSLISSMAGMEFFSWLLFLLSLPLLVRFLKLNSLNYPVVYLFGFFLVYAILREYFIVQSWEAVVNVGQYRWILLSGAIALVLKYESRIMQYLPYLLTFVFLAMGIFGFFQILYGLDPFRSTSTYLNMNEAYPYIIYRAKGFFTSPMTFGNVAVILLCLAGPSLLLARARSKGVQVLYKIAFAVFFINFLFTFNRGAWLAWFIATLIILGLINGKLVLRFIAITFVVMFVISMLFTPIRQRILTSTNTNTASVKGRIAAMSGHYYAFLESPLFGHGKKESWFESNRQQVKHFKWEKRYFSHAHNNQLQMLADYGLVGFILFYGANIFLLLAFLRSAFQFRSDYRNHLIFFGGLGGFLAFHIAGLTEATLLDSEVIHSYVFCVAICVASGNMAIEI